MLLFPACSCAKDAKKWLISTPPPSYTDTLIAVRKQEVVDVDLRLPRLTHPPKHLRVAPHEHKANTEQLQTLRRHVWQGAHVGHGSCGFSRSIIHLTSSIVLSAERIPDKGTAIFVAYLTYFNQLQKAFSDKYNKITMFFKCSKVRFIASWKNKTTNFTHLL